MRNTDIQSDLKNIFESFQEMEDRIVALEERAENEGQKAEFSDKLEERLTKLEGAEKPQTKAEIEAMIKKQSEEHKKSLIVELRKIINEP